MLTKRVPTQVCPPAWSILWTLRTRRYGENASLSQTTTKDHSQFSPRKESVTGCFYYDKASGNDYIEKKIFVSFNKLQPHCKWMNVQTLSDGSTCYGAKLYDTVKSISGWGEIQPCSSPYGSALTSCEKPGLPLGFIAVLKGSREVKYFKIDPGSVNSNEISNLVQQTSMGIC